ncbi:AAA family ATPase [Noviherbaspirillum denitrificans]|uniref:AAA family ATPase n=1 Tax=Noviherbaspirillum denitrificans TaxID=1968433 RepID=A0A254TJ71_9BURK|nr:MoxR family ATPase [Noviherbaspirillum denitrificans]OWW22679.1 AAA family ATPase [Noviherbaspirillum denitrificans]
MNLHQTFHNLRASLDREVLGQGHLTERLLIALLADGHLLLEGPPGLAKTRAIKVLAALVEGSFHRLQFTPDLLPADLTGTEVFRPQDGSFHFERGPLFHELVLADEINRAPAKVQSALLEAMAERQVTIGRETYAMPPLFMVMATQNPIEHEGTYPLPEAQLDRFLMQVQVDYPDASTERGILALARRDARRGADMPAEPCASREQVFAARQAVLDLHVADELEDYIVRLAEATRRPDSVDASLAGTVRYGASPRGTIALERCARARAWLAGRDYVSPEDIQQVAPDVLRHRVLLTYEAQAAGMTVDRLAATLLQKVRVP